MALRENFGKLPEAMAVPDLMDIQLESYTRFFQPDIAPEERTDSGFDRVLKEIFPIESMDQECALDYVKYELGEPRSEKEDCCRDGTSFAAPLYITFRLTTPTETKDERVFMGDIPLMTDAGSFIINGVERVIVSQLHRSPGIYFERIRHASGRSLYSFRIIPDRGSWMEVQFDVHDLIYIFLDRRRRRRRFLLSTFLRALGYESNKTLLDAIYGIAEVKVADLA